MPFLPETWKAKVTECLWEWRLRVEQARPAAVYSTLSAAALWPLVQAAQSTGMLPVALALGNVVAGVGGNLIAAQVRWQTGRQRRPRRPSRRLESPQWLA
jgi:hypothetical protein